MTGSLVSLLSTRPTLETHPGWHLGWGLDSADWIASLKRRVWKLAKPPFEIPWLYGTRVLVSARDQTSQVLFLTGVFEPNEFVFLDRVLKPGMTFLDIGANIGLYSLFAAAKVGPAGTVVSLEPSSREFKKLQSNVELNGFRQVQLLRVAASDHAGSAELRIANEEQAGLNTLGQFAHDTGLAGNETVRLERIDELGRRLELARVDVIKMDVEGAELYALHGAEETLKAFQPLLLLEMSDRSSAYQDSSSAKVWDYLESLGYRFFCFDQANGSPAPAALKANYDGENLIAVHQSVQARGCGDQTAQTGASEMTLLAKKLQEP